MHSLFVYLFHSFVFLSSYAITTIRFSNRLSFRRGVSELRALRAYEDMLDFRFFVGATPHSREILIEHTYGREHCP